MKPIDDESLSKLLRLKRYEQPPPEYFEGFLKEFHQRQRAEMLRRPAWRLFIERLMTHYETRFAPMLPDWSGAQMAYGGASVAVLLIAGVFTFNMVQHPGEGMNFAENTLAPAADRGAATVAPHLPVQRASAPRLFPSERLTLNSSVGLPEAVLIHEKTATASRNYPRYVLDARPASYEPPFSF